MQVLQVVIAQAGWLRGQAGPAVRPRFCSAMHAPVEGVLLWLDDDSGGIIPWEFP